MSHIHPSLLLSGTTGALLLSAVCQAEEPKPLRPNIIYIMADDMGYANLGCYGAKRIKTPHIDRLAAEGIRFTHHYSGTSVSAPSRCSLMTGLTTGHCQIRGNLQWEPYGQLPLAEGTVTVAAKLKEAGYRTALIGKWGLGVEGTSGDPLKQGFDYYYGYLCQVLAHNQSPEYLMENGIKIPTGNVVQWDNPNSWAKGLGSFPLIKKHFSQELFTAKALQFIEQNRQTPFFLYFPVVVPHDNGEAPKGKRYSDIPSFAPYENEPWSDSEKGFAAMITYLDQEVGKIINRLDELGLSRNTLIIFTSDNGGDSPDGFHNESNLPFRGHKRDLYEGGIRVPLIARWSGTIAPGGVSSHPSAFWDFMPTACELAGAATPAIGDGISYLPELLGKQQPQHDSFYFEFHEMGGKQAIVRHGWKCIRLHTKEGDKMVTELYHLDNDPTESINLADKYPDKVARLVALMEKSRSENSHFNLFGE